MDADGEDDFGLPPRGDEEEVGGEEEAGEEVEVGVRELPVVPRGGVDRGLPIFTSMPSVDFLLPPVTLPPFVMVGEPAKVGLVGVVERGAILISFVEEGDPDFGDTVVEVEAAGVLLKGMIISEEEEGGEPVKIKAEVVVALVVVDGEGEVGPLPAVVDGPDDDGAIVSPVSLDDPAVPSPFVSILFSPCSFVSEMGAKRDWRKGAKFDQVGLDNFEEISFFLLFTIYIIYRHPLLPSIILMEVDTTTIASSSDHEPPVRSPSYSGPKPKGILKNQNPATAPSSGPRGLVWDEGNLQLNELQKDSTMK